MIDWPEDNDDALDAFYGQPDGTMKWEVVNLVYIPVPWMAYLAGSNVFLSHGLRVHKKVADSLTKIFSNLWETFDHSQIAIESVGLNQIGGTYYLRSRRGALRLSNHARGIAIDIDPLHNKMRRDRKFNKGTMDPRIVSEFSKEGWRWGAGFGDPMHFDAIKG